MNLKIFISGMLFLCAITLHAQQDPIYNYSHVSPVFVNPAFTGIGDVFEGTLQYRKMWQGIPGSPNTFSFAAHSSLHGSQIGTGIFLVNDRLGITDYLHLNAGFSYKIRLQTGLLSFGLQAGIAQFKNDYSSLDVRDQGDVFDSNEQEIKPSFGAGIVYKTSKASLGFSVPRLLSVAQTIDGQNIQELGRLFTFFGAYDFSVTERLVLRPSGVLRLPEKGKVNYDIRLDALISGRFKPGIYTRTFGYLGFSAGILATESLKVNYQYELPLGDTPSQFNAHEISVFFRTKLFDFHRYEDWL